MGYLLFPSLNFKYVWSVLKTYSSDFLRCNRNKKSFKFRWLTSVDFPSNLVIVFASLRLQEFVFSFLLSCRLFLRPHELLGRLLDSVPDSECLESLVSVLAEWTLKFPYDYRDERMMSHVKHIVARWGESALAD